MISIKYRRVCKKIMQNSQKGDYIRFSFAFVVETMLILILKKSKKQKDTSSIK